MVNYDAVDVYRHTFAARLDVYSAWTPEGWRPVRSEMTVEVIANGLLGKAPAISTFFIAPDGMTHVAAVDFDADDGSSLASALAVVMHKDGAHPYLEGSRRGAHLWLPLGSRMPARQVRAALLHWCEKASLPHPGGRLDPRVELRPAADVIPEGGVGHALRMPLMPHPKTGQRHRLTTATGEPLPTRLSDIVLSIEQTPEPVVQEAAMLYRPRIEPSSIPSSYRTPKAYRDDDASASEILTTVWGAVGARPGRATRCPAHDDVHPSLSILKDDKRAICHSPSCILNNNGKGRGTWELKSLALDHE